MILSMMALTLIVGGGCFQPSAGMIPQQRAVNIISEAKKTVSEQQQDRAFAWRSLQSGIARGEQITYQDGWKTRLVIYRFDPKLFRFRLVNSKQAKTIRAWRDELSNASFIINGVYFHDDDTPVGSLRIDGKELSKTEFDGNESGMFEFDGDPSVVKTVKDSPFIHQFSSSAQSYPFLVKDGVAAVLKDSNMSARRSFIGMDQKGFMYLGAFPDGDISLYELSQVLSKLPVEWKNVLNLDGGSSTSYFSRISESEEIEDGYAAIPNVIVVESR